MKNEGSIDRIIRVVLGLGLLVAAWFALGLNTGAVLGIVAAAVSAVLILTGIAGFCPAYKLVGLNSCPLKN